MNSLVLFFLLVAAPLLSNDEELLYIRRIENMSCEEEGPFLKRHIEEFCQKFPQSRAIERFQAKLGNLAFQEKHYEQAIAYYESIRDPQIKKEVEGKKWHSLYLLGKSSDLLVEIAPGLCAQNPETRFYFAQALYSEGLKGSPSQLDEAIDQFDELTSHPNYAAAAKLALAEIYHHLGHEALSSQYYTELADDLEKGGVEQEEALFKAACALKDQDEERSLKIASHLARFALHTRKESAHLWLFLLIRGGHFAKILEHQEELLAALPDHKKPLCHACLAKMYFEKREYAKSALHLDHCEGELYDLMKVVVYSKIGQYDKACAIAEKESQDPALLYQRARLALMRGRLEEALICWKRLPITKESVRLRVDIAVAEGVHESLIASLTSALALPEAYSADEKVYYTLLLAKSYLALKEGKNAIDTLVGLENDSPEKEFLLALAYFQINDCEKGVFHGELALAAGEEGSEKKKLHLSLFNAYRALKLEHPDEEYTHLAANHLFAALGGVPISEDNLLWLAGYFTKKYETSNDSLFAHKAVAILTSLLQDDSAFFDFEKEAIELATLYTHLKEYDLAEVVLERLMGLYKQTPEYHWRGGAKAKLAQAQLFSVTGHIESALALYMELTKEGDKKIATPAKLAMARLQLKQGHVTAALDALQELQLQKNASTEPCHLEAAIDRATTLASLFPPETQKKRLMQLLVEVKEEFGGDEDIASKDYHQALERLPEKGRLYQAYIRFLDAKITQLQAEIAKLEGNHLDANTKEKAAFALFSSLRSNKYGVTEYLKEKSGESSL